jgi:hypothetical protein
MRKSNGKDARRDSTSMVALAGLLIAVLLFPGIAPAAKKKSGHILTLTLKTGGVAKGELLAVKDDRLIIFDANSLSGEEIRIGDVAQIRVQKKAKFFKLLGLGILIGGASGALVGFLDGDDDPHVWFGFTAVQKAGLGALLGGGLGTFFGGIAGAVSGNDDRLDCGSLSPEALARLLGKLKKYARDTGETPAIDR